MVAAVVDFVQQCCRSVYLFLQYIVSTVTGSLLWLARLLRLRPANSASSLTVQKRSGSKSFTGPRSSSSNPADWTRPVTLFSEPGPAPQPRYRKTLILDLDETLVHSTTKRAFSSSCDARINVMINTTMCMFYVFKRPYVDLFLAEVQRWYEVVIFTASLQRYADPVIDHIDRAHKVKRRYFREHCTQVGDTFVKEIHKLGQQPRHTVIIDNSPVAYSRNEDVAIPIKGWYNDNDNDRELLDLLPFLEALRFCHDVRSVLSLRCQPLTGQAGSPGSTSSSSSSLTRKSASGLSPTRGTSAAGSTR